MIGRAGMNVMHPQWDSDGNILFISDETNWWNIYRQEGTNNVNVYRVNEDLAQPQWKLGENAFSVDPKGNVVFVYDKVET